MKSIPIFLLAAASVGCGIVSARAQDLAPPRLISPPPETSPSPTPTPSPTEGATPKTQTSSASPAERTERPLSAPRTDVLREKPVRALEQRGPLIRRASAPPKTRGTSRPTFDLGESSWVTAATIRALENRWEAAVKEHDAKALDELLAPNFEGSSHSGASASKERMLALLRRDKNEYRSAKAHGMIVQRVSGDTVKVTGTSTESGVTAEGKKFKISRKFTDTWKQQSGRWRCVSSHVTDRRAR